MTMSITPKQIKKTNRQLIYDFIYRERKVSQQDIAYSLRLSRPTVSANLIKLEEDGLIYKNGQLDTDLTGRKAVAYSIINTARIAIGVELTRRLVKIIAVDLYGEKIDRVEMEIQYENQDLYYKKVCDRILAFIEENQLGAEQILGIGFAMQGLVSTDGKTVLYGLILNCSGLTIDAFSRYLPYPCTFIHDPDGAALSELWCSPELTDAVYLSLSRHLGGAMITGRRVNPGKHGHSATFEHIQVRPQGGELCYCGKRGCLETICSMKALLGDEDPDSFFQAVRAGAAGPKKRWRTYLTNLAKVINALHLVRDVDFILGGHLAPYLTEEDIRVLYEEIRQLTPFDEASDFILISKMPSHNITVGAALPYIRNFLEDIDLGVSQG